MTAPPTLTTPRLCLRPFLPEDAPAVQRLAGHAAVADTAARLPHPYPDGAAEAWIATHPDAWVQRRELTLAMTLRANGELLGAIGLVSDGERGPAELGYWVGVPYWGRGYATEAATAVVDYAFRALGVPQIFAHHFARNPASGRVLVKAGLRREGVRPAAFVRHGRAEDLVDYRRARADWPGLPGTEPAAPTVS